MSFVFQHEFCVPTCCLDKKQREPEKKIRRGVKLPENYFWNTKLGLYKKKENVAYFIHTKFVLLFM
jgi:hypothetical protein